MIRHTNEQINFMSEDDELKQLMNQLKQSWDNHEQYLNSLEDEPLIEEWTYRTLVQKQLYRYILRLVREQYERKDGIVKYMEPPPRDHRRFYFSR